MIGLQHPLAQQPNRYMGAHSLGGAMVSLAALDAVVGGVVTQPPLVITFGSLHVGDGDFATAYAQAVPGSLSAFPSRKL